MIEKRGLKKQRIKRGFIILLFTLILILLSQKAIAEDITNLREISFIDKSAKIDSGDININLISAYNILGLDYAKSVQEIKITNPEIEPKPFSIVISYPKHAQFENLKLSNETLPKIEVAFPQDFWKLTNKLDSDVIPEKDHSSKSFSITISPNSTINIVASITHDNIDSKRWYVNILGSSGGVSLLYTSGKYKIYDVFGNVWWRRISVNDTITANTILDFPHFIDFNIEKVHPAKVQWKNNTLVSIGEKWGGPADELKIDSINSSEVNWKTPITLNANDELRIALGKKINFSGSESTYETRFDNVLANLSAIPTIAELNISGSNFTETKGIGGCINDGACGTCGEVPSQENCCGEFHLFEPGGGWCKSDSSTYTYTAWYSTTPSCSLTCTGHGCSASCSHTDPTGQILSSTPGNIQVKCNDAGAEVARNDAGSGQHYGDGLSFSGSSSVVTFVAKNITFNTTSTEIFSSSTWMINNESEKTNDFASNLSTGNNNLTFTSLTKGEFYIYFTKQIEGIPPDLTGIPDNSTDEDTAPPSNWIDLYPYASDDNDTDDELTFSVDSQTNPSLINCSISSDRYLDCTTPTANQTGSNDVTVKITDTDGLTDTDIVKITVNSINDPPLFTIITTDDSTPGDPTVIGNNVTFTANISDVDMGQIMLLICDDDGISGTSCANIQYCRDPITGYKSEGSVSCKNQTNWAIEDNYNWTSFACDNNSVCTTGETGIFHVTTLNLTFNPVMFLNNTEEWNYSGYYSDKETVCFTQELNDALQNCIPDEDGYCNIPIMFYSDTAGSLKISEIDIYFNITEYRWDTSDMPEGTNYRVKIKSTDSSLNSSWDGSNADFTISHTNVTPIVNSVGITPSTPYTNETLNCAFNITDENPNEDVSYNVTWYKNGEIQISNNEYGNATPYLGQIIDTNSTGDVELSFTIEADVWTCNILASDGIFTYQLNSSSITIQNSPPYWSTPIPDQQIVEDSNTTIFNLSSYVTDDNIDDILTFSISNENLSEVDCTVEEYNSTINLTIISISGWTGIGSNAASCSVNVSDEASSNILTFNINVTSTNNPPTIILDNPKNNTEEKGTYNLTFEYYVTDIDSLVDNCSLILNNQINQTDSSINETILQQFSANLINGNYTWNINCTDDENLQATFTVFNLSVNVQYTPPNVSNVSIAPIIADKNTNLFGYGTYFDPKNDSDIEEWNSTYKWYINDAPNKTGFLSQLLLCHFDNSYTCVDGERNISGNGTSFNSGKYSQGLLINDNDTLRYSATNNFDRNKGTIEFWIKPKWNGSDSGDNYFFSYVTNAAPQHYLDIYKNGSDGNLKFAISDWDGVTEAKTNISSWLANEWHYIAVTWNQTMLRLYVDGVEVDSMLENNSIKGTGNDLMIGNEWHGIKQANSIIDELRINNRVLLDTEISESYNKKRAFYNQEIMFSSSNFDGNDEIIFEYTPCDSVYNCGIPVNSSKIKILDEGENKFYVKNSSSANIAFFDDNGNLILKGGCTSGGTCTASDDSFIIKNNVGEEVAHIDSNGNLCIETEDCSYKSSSCNPTNDAFIVKNETGSIVSYIDITGDLCLTGGLVEYGNP